MRKGNTDKPGSGEQFDAFLLAMSELAGDCSEEFQQIDFADKGSRLYAKGISLLATTTRLEISQLNAALQEAPEGLRQAFDSAVVPGALESIKAAKSIDGLEAKYRATEKASALSDVGGNIIQKAKDKIKDEINKLPGGDLINGLVEDLDKLISALGDGVKDAAGMSEAERQIEEKLDVIGEVLHPDFEKYKKGFIKNKRSGKPVVPPQEVIKNEIRWIEGFLKILAVKLGKTLVNDRKGSGWVIDPDHPPLAKDPEVPELSVKTELHGIEDVLNKKIIYKIDKLAEYLGKTLVAGYDHIDPSVSKKGWDVEPPPSGHTMVPGSGKKVTPDKSVKAELQEVLDRLDDLFDFINLLAWPVPGPPGPPGPPGLPGPAGPPGPPGSGGAERIPAGLALTKKIYVWEEDVFRPRRAQDIRIVDIDTPAFDVSGWIDLSSMQGKDSVRVVIEVSLAGRPFVPFSDVSFAGRQQTGLKHFTEFANGREVFVGTKVRISISQPTSGQRYKPPMDIAYQFIVESQS